MSRKKRLIFLGSALLGVLFWGLILKSFIFSSILLAGLLVHEYGHYYTMGREGITKKDMVVVPPFGALARSYENWPSYAAEARIALAGPLFGLGAGILLALCGKLANQPLIVAAAFVNCIINLFNLTPALPLDGGRVLRSILASIHYRLHIICFIVSAIFIVFLAQRNLLIAGFIAWVAWNEYKVYAAGLPENRHAIENGYLAAVSALRSAQLKKSPDDCRLEMEAVERGAKTLDIVRAGSQMPPMKASGMFASSVAYLAIAALHFGILHFCGVWLQEHNFGFDSVAAYL